MKKTQPDKLFRQLAKSCNQELLSLASTMQANPDIFSSLVVVKAAENLNIDIDVSYDNVLEAFNIDGNTKSPFF